jgi:hypothetical protein
MKEKFISITPTFHIFVQILRILKHVSVSRGQHTTLLCIYYITYFQPALSFAEISIMYF